MTPPNDGTSELPVLGETQMDIDNDVFNLLTMHALQGAQVTADGRSALAEFTRLGHIRASSTVSFREATGVRHVAEAGKTSTQGNANAS